MKMEGPFKFSDAAQWISFVRLNWSHVFVAVTTASFYLDREASVGWGHRSSGLRCVGLDDRQKICGSYCVNLYHNRGTHKSCWDPNVRGSCSAAAANKP